MADQTLRAIQPMKCIGTRCNNSQIVVDPIINSNPMLMTNTDFNSFMFKEFDNNNSNNFYNLRGSQ